MTFTTESRITEAWRPLDPPTGEYLARDYRGRVWHVRDRGPAWRVRATDTVTGETHGVVVGDMVMVVP